MSEHHLEVFLLWRVKCVPRQAEVAQGVPGRLRPRIISTFGTTRVVGSQPYAPAAFTPGEIPGTHFQRLNLPQATWFCQREPRKKSPVTPPGIDPGTVRLVPQRCYEECRKENIFKAPSQYRPCAYWPLRAIICLHTGSHVRRGEHTVRATKQKYILRLCVSWRGTRYSHSEIVALATIHASTSFLVHSCWVLTREQGSSSSWIRGTPQRQF